VAGPRGCFRVFSLAALRSAVQMHSATEAAVKATRRIYITFRIIAQAVLFPSRSVGSDHGTLVLALAQAYWLATCPSSLSRSSVAIGTGMFLSRVSRFHHVWTSDKVIARGGVSAKGPHAFPTKR